LNGTETIHCIGVGVIQTKDTWNVESRDCVGDIDSRNLNDTCSP